MVTQSTRLLKLGSKKNALRGSSAWYQGKGDMLSLGSALPESTGAPEVVLCASHNSGHLSSPARAVLHC